MPAVAMPDDGIADGINTEKAFISVNGVSQPHGSP
jgi:hypothetical protein